MHRAIDGLQDLPLDGPEADHLVHSATYAIGQLRGAATERIGSRLQLIEAGYQFLGARRQLVDAPSKLIRPPVELPRAVIKLLGARFKHACLCLGAAGCFGGFFHLWRGRIFPWRAKRLRGARPSMGRFPLREARHRSSDNQRQGKQEDQEDAAPPGGRRSVWGSKA